MQGVRGEQGDSGTTLRLVDGNNQDLGILIDREDTNRFVTFHPELSRILRFEVVQTVPKLHIFYDSFYFSGANCTGDMFARVEHAAYEDIFKWHGVNNDEVLMYKFDLDATPTTMLARSRSDPNGCFTFPSGFPSPVEIDFAVPVIGVTLPFSEPLAWPLRIVEI